MKKLTKLTLAVLSAVIITSCGGDSKEALVDDTISLMKESAAAMASGDKDAIAAIEEKGKKLEERAKALGMDTDDPSSLPDDLKKKMEDAAAEMAETMKEAMAEKMKEAMKGAAGTAESMTK